MAIRVTRWNWIKIILFVFDFIIIIINSILFALIFYLIHNEFYNRGSLKLFIIPFLISILNLVIDIFMNKTNLAMKYAGHNRYGMITRFFMFYFILTIIIYSDQREKYVIKNKDENIFGINNLIGIIGAIDIGLLIFSMILSFLVIDIQNTGLILVRKKKKKKVVGEIEQMNELNKIILDETE